MTTSTGPMADRAAIAGEMDGARAQLREPEAALHRGMQCPTGWDPYFGYLTPADVHRYPTRPFDHSRRQLTLCGGRS